MKLEFPQSCIDVAGHVSQFLVALILSQSDSLFRHFLADILAENKTCSAHAFIDHICHSEVIFKTIIRRSGEVNSGGYLALREKHYSLVWFILIAHNVSKEPIKFQKSNNRGPVFNKNKYI